MKKRNTQVVLSIKQMKELEAIGLDTSDASMFWLQEPSSKTLHLSVRENYGSCSQCFHPIPAYTLEDIMMKIKGTLDYNRLINAGIGTPWTYTVHKNDYDCIDKGIYSYGKTPLEAALIALICMQNRYPKCIKILSDDSHRTS